MTEPADVVVVGNGPTGHRVATLLADADPLLTIVVLDKDPARDAHVPGATVRPGAMALDLVLDGEGVLAGLQVLPRKGEREVLATRALVLATGDLGGLLPGGSDRATGDGLVLAHRAGAPLDLDPSEPAGVVETSPAGRTLVDGLLAAGDGAGGTPPEAVARAVLEDLQGDLANRRRMGDVHLQPDIDSPLPEGFAELKLARLRELLASVLGPEAGPGAAGKALPALHRLKGEADAFDRARLDAELHTFRFACEAGILLARARADR